MQNTRESVQPDVRQGQAHIGDNNDSPTELSLYCDLQQHDDNIHHGGNRTSNYRSLVFLQVAGAIQKLSKDQVYFF